MHNSRTDITVIIPARGGSQRLPEKNVRKIWDTGESVLQHAIMMAKQVSHQVIVTTDSVAIGEKAMAAGAMYAPRSPEMAKDEVGTQEVIADAFDRLAIPDEFTVICLYPCTPLLRVEHLQEGLRIAALHPQKFVRSVGKYGSPVHAALEITAAGHLRPAMPQFAHWDHAKFPPRYFDAGQFYIGSAKMFRDRVDLGYNAVPCILPPWVAVDINTVEDWSLAMRLFHGKDFQGEGVE